MSDIMFNHVMTAKSGHYFSKGKVKMNAVSRVLVLIATLLLPIAYFTPIWEIQLWAPQYPEGLSMQIWIDRLTGDITIINGLNHYIGMSNIEESMFPELNFLKYILYGIIGIGLLTVIVNKKWMLRIFAIVLLALALAAMVDMYLWGYKYGHNLNPHAAIKIEGESYQPPLIGYKQLLNFLALSIPDKGGYALFASTALAIVALIIQWVRDRKVKSSRLVNQLSIVLFSMLLPSCQTGSDDLNFGVDDCDHCGMKLVDNRFGAKLVTDKGRVFKFDDLNCMVGYIDDTKHSTIYEKHFVIDFSNPGNLIDATSAIYLKSENLKSPMNANTAAFMVRDSAERVADKMPGLELTWAEVQSNTE